VALDETSRSFKNFSECDLREQQELKSNFQPKSGSHYRLALKLYPSNQWIHVGNVPLCEEEQEQADCNRNIFKRERKGSAQDHGITGGAGMGLYSSLYLLLFISTGTVLCTCSLHLAIYPGHNNKRSFWCT